MGDALAAVFTLPAAFAAASIVGALLVWRRHPAGRVVSAGLCLLFLLATVPACSGLTARLFAWRHQRLDRVPEPRPRVLVLLGGGQVNVGDRQALLPVLTETSAERVLEAVRAYRVLGDPVVISSGGASRRDLPANADVMKAALVYLGVPPDRVLTETRSTNTREQALLVAPMLHERGAERAFVLVTSRVHMPRAAAAFRAVGLAPIEAPARDSVERNDWVTYLTPSVNGLEFTRAVAHEVVGLAYYRARGWAR